MIIRKYRLLAYAIRLVNKAAVKKGDYTLSCTFWNMRRRSRMQKKSAERENMAVEIPTTSTKAEEKAVTANDNERTGRKSKAGNSSD